MKNKIPRFKNEAKERAFWAKRDSADYIDWSKAKKTAFPELRPSVKSISLRLPKVMLEELKILANQKDVPYQSLLKVFLAERIEKEFKMKAA